jgi:hypothetical protein
MPTALRANIRADGTGSHAKVEEFPTFFMENAEDLTSLSAKCVL